MAWYNSLKDLTHDVGSVASNPWVEGGLGLLTGGATIPLLAGAVGGALKPGGNLKGAVTGAIKGGTAGALGNSSTVANLLGMGGGAGAGSTLGLGSITDWLKQHGGSGSILGTLGDLVKGGVGAVGNLAKGGSGSLVDTLIGGLGAYSGAKQMEQGDKLRQQGVDAATGSYNDRAPFRKQGADMALNAQKPDLSSIFSDVGNPYANPSAFAGRGAGPLPAGAVGNPIAKAPPGFSPINVRRQIPPPRGALA